MLALFACHAYFGRFPNLKAVCGTFRGTSRRMQPTPEGVGSPHIVLPSTHTFLTRAPLRDGHAWKVLELFPGYFPSLARHGLMSRLAAISCDCVDRLRRMPPTPKGVGGSSPHPVHSPAPLPSRPPCPPFPSPSDFPPKTFNLQSPHTDPRGRRIPGCRIEIALHLTCSDTDRLQNSHRPGCGGSRRFRTFSTRAPDGHAWHRPSSEGFRIRGAGPAVCGIPRASIKNGLFQIGLPSRSFGMHPIWNISKESITLLRSN
jgi:hypothetical protein